MKIKIDDHGCLSIWRKSEKGYKIQFCPFSIDVDSENDQCGDWCPLFQIEEIYESGNMSCTDERLVCTELQLCQNKKIEVDDIEYG